MMHIHYAANAVLRTFTKSVMLLLTYTCDSIFWGCETMFSVFNIIQVTCSNMILHGLVQRLLLEYT